MMHALFKSIATAALLLAAFGAQAQNLVQNPGFESAMASWTRPGLLWATLGSIPRSGTRSAMTGCPSPGCMDLSSFNAAPLYQDIPTASGSTYTISFWYRTTADGDAPVDLQALVGSGVLTSGGAGTCSGNCVFGTTAATATWTPVTRNFVATGATTRILFLGRNSTGTIYIDDISVEAAAAAPGVSAVPGLGLWGSLALAVGLAALGAGRWRRSSGPR